MDFSDTKGPFSRHPLGNLNRQVIIWDTMWVYMVGKVKIDAKRASKPEILPKTTKDRVLQRNPKMNQK